jgi:hypothetical protein
MQAAALNKGANSNAMFLLKTMHGYRENDSLNTKVNVGVSVVPNVMIVKDHGSDAEWAAKAAEQQRALTLNAASQPKQIEATTEPPQASEVDSSAAWVLPVAAQAAPSYPTPPPRSYPTPEWRGNT